MRLRNLFISSFNSHPDRRSRNIGYVKFRRRLSGAIFSGALALVFLDVMIGLIFRPPNDPRTIPSPLQAYFDYGRSVESKLRRMVGPNATADAPIVQAGWIAHDCNRSTSASPGQVGIEIYGNSFTDDIADQIELIDHSYTIQRFAGPGAPPNHSYACFVYRNEAGLAKAPIQIIGVLASTLHRMLTISGITTSFEQPQPFAYPRFTIGRDKSLVPHWSSIQTLEELRSALNDRAKWKKFLGDLAARDFYYAPELISADFADHSVLLRMVRRAWGQRLVRVRTASLHPENGFDGAPEISEVLRTLLVDFADRTRAATERPIVILIEDRGYGGVLSTMLGQTLRENRIEFLATGEIVRSDDIRNFVPDGHFTSEAFSKLARATLQLLHKTQ